MKDGLLIVHDHLTNSSPPTNESVAGRPSIGISDRVGNSEKTPVWWILVVDRVDVGSVRIHSTTTLELLGPASTVLGHEVEHRELGLLGKITPERLITELGGGLGDGYVLDDDSLDQTTRTVEALKKTHQQTLHLVLLHIRETLLGLSLVLVVVGTHEHLTSVDNLLALITIGELK